MARTYATEGLHLAERHEDHFEVLANGLVLGFLELSLGNAPGAHEQMAPLLELAQRMGIEEPGIFPFLPDEIEALVALGELDPAQALLVRLEEQARARDRPLALAGAARCRGMLATARGDFDHAIEAVEEAVEHHGRVAQPFDLARTRLVQGQIQRRMKRKRPARATLEQALETFEHLGARLWAQEGPSRARPDRRTPSLADRAQSHRTTGRQPRWAGYDEPGCRIGPVRERAHRAGQPEAHLRQVTRAFSDRTGGADSAMTKG